VGGADKDACKFQFEPVGRPGFTASCDVAKGARARAGIPYENPDAPGAVASVRVGTVAIDAFEGEGLSATEFSARSG
jgi:hypothetical protein